MTPTEIFTEIESMRYSVMVNIASGTETFLHCMKDESAFQELRNTVLIGEIKDRLFELCDRRDFDHNYENPNDAAIASYLWALKDVSYTNHLCIEKIRETPMLWWARHLANLILIGQAEHK